MCFRSNKNDLSSASSWDCHCQNLMINVKESGKKNAIAVIKPTSTAINVQCVNASPGRGIVFFLNFHVI